MNPLNKLEEAIDKLQGCDCMRCRNRVLKLLRELREWLLELEAQEQSEQINDTLPEEDANAYGEDKIGDKDDDEQTGRDQLDG